MPPPTGLPGLQDAVAASDPTPASARQGWTLAAMCIGLFMVMLDSTITSNATPTIQRSFDMSITQLQWVNNAYTLVTGAAVILTGRLGDMFGRKRLYTVGMVIFVVASALSGLAPSSSWLIGSRALQGLGAALLAPLSLSIINDAFPASSRGRAIGIWAAVSGLALSIGPLLGGVLTESVSWRAVFFLNVPISVVGLVLTAVGVRESGDPTAGRSVDVPGAVLVSAGIFLVILGAMQGREWGWTSGATLLTLAIGALLLVAFVGVEARVAAPLVNPSLLRNSDLLSSNAVGFLMAFGMFGSLFFLPLYMQNVLHYSPAISGLATLPLTVLLTITSAAAGRIADAIGPRVPIGVGMTVIAAGFALLTRLAPDSGYGSIVVPYTLLGIGFGLVMSPISTAAMGSVSADESGAVAGIVNMARQVGGTLGIALLGVVFTARATSTTTALLAGHGEQHATAAARRLVAIASDPQAFARYRGSLAPEAAHALSEGARDVFVTSLTTVMQVSAGVSALGAALALALLPHWRRGHRPTTSAAAVHLGDAPVL